MILHLTFDIHDFLNKLGNIPDEKHLLKIINSSFYLFLKCVNFFQK